MKKILIILFIVGVSFGYAWSQCNPFYDLKEGSIWELSTYNAKDKLTGRQINELKTLTKMDNGWKALVHFKAFDKKDEMVYEKDMELVCENGVITVDMERFIPEESLQAFKDMDMTVSMDNLEWPSELSVGKTLDDGSINISGDFMNMTVDITDRKVEGKEKITTPAGTFDAFKITYKVNMKMMMTRESKAVDYIAEDVGLVRSESYNNNDKLVSYTILTMHR